LGLPLEHDADHYGYSLSLGSADVDLLSLANAYRALAQVGRWTPPRFVPEGTSGTESVTGSDSGLEPDTAAVSAHPTRPFRQVIDPMAAWLVGDILSDRQARARGFGLESVLALDPDMSLANQGLRLRATPMSGLERLHWHVDGVQVGTGPSVIWRPTPGRH